MTKTVGTIEKDDNGKLSLEAMGDSVFSIDDVSDGFHTFGDLYKHREILWITLCRAYAQLSFERYGYEGVNPVWRAIYHSDKTSYNGWFILGMFDEKGKQITYHLPFELWGKCDFARTLDYAPEFDGHSSDDVLKRLSSLFNFKG